MQLARYMITEYLQCLPYVIFFLDENIKCFCHDREYNFFFCLGMWNVINLIGEKIISNWCVEICCLIIPLCEYNDELKQCIQILRIKMNTWRISQKLSSLLSHDGIIKWKHFSRYWPFVQEKSPVSSEFPSQRPVTRSFDAFFDRLNKQLRTQSWGWWFETPSHSLLILMLSFKVTNLAAMVAPVPLNKK